MRTDTRQIKLDIIPDIERVRAHVLATGNEATQESLATIETFVAVALRVFAKTNPSKLRSEARTVEISHLLPQAKPCKR